MKHNNRKAYGKVLPMILFATAMLFCQSCETDSEEMCEVEEEICVEPISICSTDSEEYLKFKGEKIFCDNGDCDSATNIVYDKCTQIESLNIEEIQLRLETILTNVRSLNY